MQHSLLRIPQYVVADYNTGLCDNIDVKHTGTSSQTSDLAKPVCFSWWGKIEAPGGSIEGTESTTLHKVT